MRPTRILLVGATGTIGAAVAGELVARGHDVTCVVRPKPNRHVVVEGASVREADMTDASSLQADGIAGERFDVVVSCMASRTGAPRDAWAIDHDAHVNLLQSAKDAGVSHFILLSAICVQKPMLAFQKAKLAFEEKLISSGLDYSIVRPTAYFKSLSGQLDRIRKGKPFLLFGDGALTACKPISDQDLAEYIADCVTDSDKRNRILPIGGPGPSLTPREQGELLFAAAGLPQKFKTVPVGMMDMIIRVLSGLGAVVPPLKDKAELARIGRYYATESMLVWDPDKEAYSAAATPSTGKDTLSDHYARLVSGDISADLGAHKVF